MILDSAAALCILAFAACAFVLRAQMLHLRRLYEVRTQALLEAEVAIAAARVYPNVQYVEAQIHSAARNASVMKKNALLFRLLWPQEYDGAFYAGERLIAQASRLSALSDRP